jgi:hypothetical protein
MIRRRRNRLGRALIWPRVVWGHYRLLRLRGMPRLLAARTALALARVLCWERVP